MASIAEQTVEDSKCGNEKFYKCVVDTESKICVNCKKIHAKEGDFIKMACRDCSQIKLVKIESFFVGGIPYGNCQECIDNTKVIQDVYQRFVWTCETEHEKTYEEINTIIEKALDEIIELPKSQLKTILRHMNGGIER